MRSQLTRHLENIAHKGAAWRPCALLLAGVALAAMMPAVAAAGDANILTSDEKAAGWVLLFDGKTLEHFIDPSKLNPPGDAWHIEDGSIAAKPHPFITEDLISKETFGDFEMEWDWKIAPGGNSGVKYLIQALPVLTRATAKPGAHKFEEHVDYALDHGATDRAAITAGSRAQIYVVGFEYQMIDNGRHPDALRGPLYQSGALYGLFAPPQDVTKPVGEFNHSRLVVRGSHVEHWLNGVKVVDASLDDPHVKETLDKRWGAGSPVTRLMTERPRKECPVSLQNHGNAVWFRTIKIHRL